MKRPVIILSTLFFLIVAFSIVRISMLNSISTAGIELDSLEKKISMYKKENILLKEKYLEVSALTNIEYKAKAQGFVEARSQVYLSSPLPLALR